MIIGIDGNEANVEKRVGISEYAFELLKQFSSSKFKVPHFAKASRGGQSLKFIIYLKDNPRDDLPIETDEWKYKVISPKRLWTQIALPLDLFKDCRLKGRQINVFFSPTHYAPRFCPIPNVVSIMDLSFIHYPQLFRASDLYQLKNWTSYSVKKAKKVLTISEASKNDIIRTYKVPEEKVVVTYPGVKFKSQNSEFKSTMQNSKVLKDKYGIEGEYILFVGTLQPRKNIVRLIEAFSHVILRAKPEGSYPKTNRDSSPAKRVQNDIMLVIVGKKGWLYEEILNAPKKFGIEEKVKFLEFVSDEELEALYKHAKLFVLPSLYEGFGLPILEAMKHGCPVITSNISSLPEAGGDAAVYVDPKNTQDIAEKIEEVLSNEKLRGDMIKKGHEQVKKFSWEKTARETLKVLEEVVST